MGPDEGLNDDLYGRGTMRATLMPNGMQMNVLQDGGGAAARAQGSINVFGIMKGTVGGVEDLDISMMMKGNGGDGGGAMFGDEGEMSDDPEGQLVVEKGGGGGTNDLETGVIVDTDSVVELVVSTRDKDREDKERDGKISLLD